MTSVRMNLGCSCRLCWSPNAELSVGQGRWQAVLTLQFRPWVTLPADRENVCIFLPEERKDPPFNSTCLLYTKSLVFSTSRPWRDQFSSLSYCQWPGETPSSKLLQLPNCISANVKPPWTVIWYFLVALFLWLLLFFFKKNLSPCLMWHKFSSSQYMSTSPSTINTCSIFFSMWPNVKQVHRRDGLQQTETSVSEDQTLCGACNFEITNINHQHIFFFF